VAGFLTGLMQVMAPPKIKGIAPNNMMQFGLTPYATGSALTGLKDRKRVHQKSH